MQKFADLEMVYSSRKQVKRIALLLLILPVLGAAGCARLSDRQNTPLPVIQDSSTPVPLTDDKEAELAAARQEMVETTIQARGVADPAVIEAMLTVPRHRFVSPEDIEQAYNDHPLPIGYGQTISQPYIVAWMTELLELKPGEKVLEIGTGSGYQAAILGQLEDIDVYTIEIVPELAESAANKLSDLGYEEVQTMTGDGYYGWPEHAPFDAILVTAAPDHLPAPLVDQLSEDGRLVIPIGPPGGYQSLWKFFSQDGELKAVNLGGVRFVPLTGEGVLSGPTSQPPTP